MNKREVFISKQMQEYQNSIVNFYSSSTNTILKYSWTYRNTGCDVISVITTLFPLKDGDMKDIKKYSKEIKRIKGADHKLSGNVYTSPFQLEGDITGSIAKQRLNESLHNEKRVFMEKLARARNSRLFVENEAAIRIQSRFRGYYTRTRISNLIACYKKKILMRQRIRQIFSLYNEDNQESNLQMTISTQTRKYANKRYQSACRIQCAFRRFLSIRYVRRLRHQNRLRGLQKALLKIQTWCRVALACRKVRSMKARHLAAKRNLSVVKIQTSFRCLLARRLVYKRRYLLRWVCARMIQNWFRVVTSKKVVTVLRNAWIRRKKYLGAVAMQRVIRGFMHRRRVDRIRMRKLYLIAFRAVTQIQRMIRGLLGRRYVHRIKTRVISAVAVSASAGNSEENVIANQSETTIQELLPSDNPFKANTPYSSGPQRRSSRVRRPSHTSSSSHSHSHGHGGHSRRKSSEEDMTTPLQALSGLDEDSLQLLHDSDIFAQARAGNTSNVADIFSGRLSAEQHTVAEMDSSGDTILTIAASYGYLDLLRKCLLWGFDINHRNFNGDNALICGIRGGHQEVVGYILNPPTLEEDEERPQNQILQSVSNEDMGIMFTTAAELGNIDLIIMLDAQGFEVSSKHPDTGMTAMHIACLRNNKQLLKQLFRMKADYLVQDAFGQLPLHKASHTSIEILSLLLDLSVGKISEDDEDAKEKYMKRMQELMVKDGDGKDCRLIAALNGRDHILKDLIHMIQHYENTKKTMEPSTSEEPVVEPVEAEVEVEEIAWSPNDVDAVLQLAADGSVECLSYIFDCGFDSSWAQESTGVTVTMVAAMASQLPVLDMLMGRSVALEQVDAHGRTALHYAAYSRNAGRILSHILLNPNAKACKLHENSLAQRDDQGWSVVYTAVVSGGTVRLDLIAATGMAISLDVRDNRGLSPLMAAVRCMREVEMTYLFNLGADATSVDKEGKNALWHLFHRHLPLGPPQTLTLPEIFWPDGMPKSLNNVYFPNRKSSVAFLDNSEEAVKALELVLAKMLLQKGCGLYSTFPTIARPPSLEIQKNSELFSLHDSVKSAGTEIETGDGEDPPELLAKQGNVAFFKMLAHVVNSSMCWRAALSCLKYENDRDCKCLLGLIDGEGLGIQVMTTANNIDITLRKDFVVGSDHSKSEHLHPFLMSFNNIYYKELSLAGWAIRLDNNNALTSFMSRGINPTLPGDNCLQDNNCLHLAARFGNTEAVDILMKSSKRLKLEKLNKLNRTAVMEGAIAGHIKTTLRICKHGGDARKGLEGRYWGWLLAFVRKKEKYEKNLQSSLFGDDDANYFSLWPDPPFTMMS